MPDNPKAIDLCNHCLRHTESLFPKRVVTRSYATFANRKKNLLSFELEGECFSLLGEGVGGGKGEGGGRGPVDARYLGPHFDLGMTGLTVAGHLHKNTGKN